MTYDFTFEHDQVSVGAAANTLFLMQQRRTAWLTLGATVTVILGIGGMALYLHLLWLLWVPVAFVLFNTSLLGLSRGMLRRRLSRALLGKSIRVQMSDSTITWSIGAESHSLPWSRFTSTRRDATNFLLCFKQVAAFVVPLAKAPADALEYAEARVRGAVV
jgi:hypothetical protein